MPCTKRVKVDGREIDCEDAKLMNRLKIVSDCGLCVSSAEPLFCYQNYLGSSKFYNLLHYFFICQSQSAWSKA
jgi:hypothetical protein